MNKKILVLGRTCAGKSFFMNKLCETGLKPIVTLTNRELRPSDDPSHIKHVNGASLVELIENNQAAYYLEYKKEGKIYYYLSTLADYKHGDIGIISPPVFKNMQDSIKNTNIVMLLQANYQTRRKRFLQRFTNKNYTEKIIEFEREWKRRCELDDSLFGVHPFTYVTSHEFKIIT